jgi:hypothetical protein
LELEDVKTQNLVIKKAKVLTSLGSPSKSSLKRFCEDKDRGCPEKALWDKSRALSSAPEQVLHHGFSLSKPMV